MKKVMILSLVMSAAFVSHSFAGENTSIANESSLAGTTYWSPDKGYIAKVPRDNKGNRIEA